MAATPPAVERLQNAARGGGMAAMAATRNTQAQGQAGTNPSIMATPQNTGMGSLSSPGNTPVPVPRPVTPNVPHVPKTGAQAQPAQAAPQSTPGQPAPQTPPGQTQQKPMQSLQTPQSSFEAQGYDPQTLGEAGANSVQARIGQIIQSGSPLQEAARTRALQMMNQRVLLNSSMAIQAAQKATIDSAFDIASTDAKLGQDRSIADQQAVNRAREFKANIHAQSLSLIHI